MRRPFFLTLLVCLVVGWLGCAQQAQQPPEDQQSPEDQDQPEQAEPRAESDLFPDPPPPAANAVDIRVLCPPAAANGQAARMIVNPPWKGVAHDPNGTVRWNLHVSGTGVLGSRSLDPKDPGSFPWDVAMDADGWAGTPNDNYPAEPPSEGHRYSITITCNDDTIDWDPRMDIWD